MVEVGGRSLLLLLLLVLLLFAAVAAAALLLLLFVAAAVAEAMVRCMAFTTGDHCPPPAFKLITVVDPGFLKRNLSACSSAEFQKDFCHDYHIAATTAVEVHTLHFLTNSGRIQFDCWHTNSGQESPGGLRDGYLIGAQCAMIIFDLNGRLTYKYLRKVHHDLLKVCGNIPVVLCGINNMDMKNREVKAKQVIFQRGRPLPYYEISTESNYNFEKPFRYLARELVGAANLHFEKSHALAEVQVDIATNREQLGAEIGVRF